MKGNNKALSVGFWIVWVLLALIVHHYGCVGEPGISGYRRTRTRAGTVAKEP